MDRRRPTQVPYCGQPFTRVCWVSRQGWPQLRSSAFTPCPTVASVQAPPVHVYWPGQSKGAWEVPGLQPAQFIVAHDG